MDKPRQTIFLIGNMNNNFSALARYIRDDGYSVKLLRYRNEPEHFSPEFDMIGKWDIETSFIDWDSRKKIFSFSSKQIRKEVQGADLIIACGSGIGFLAKAGIKVDLAIPYGADVYDLPFYNYPGNPLYLVAKYTFSLYQRKGFRQAGYVLLEGLNPGMEAIINRLKLKRRIKTSIPMLHEPTYRNVTMKDTKGPLELKFDQVYESSEFVIFHHSRHLWKTIAGKEVSKGNDIFFNACKKFIEQNPKIIIRIITLEYGRDLEHSKKLIKELEIEKNVVWFPLQKRRDIMYGLSSSNVVVGELGSSYNLYGIIIEAMCAGTPVIHSRTDSFYMDDYPTLYPMYNANNESEVQVRLQEILDSPLEAKRIGVASKKWYEVNIVQPFQFLIEKQLMNKASIKEI